MSRPAQFFGKSRLCSASGGQKRGVDRRSTGPSKDFIGALLVHVTEIGVRQLVRNDERKLRVGTRQAQDARLDDDSFITGEGIRCRIRDQFDWNRTCFYRE